MNIAAKLQLKPGSTVALLAIPDDLQLDLPNDDESGHILVERSVLDVRYGRSRRRATARSYGARF